MGGFHYLMMLYFLYSYSVRIEKEEFAGKPADMAYMLLTIFTTSSEFGSLHISHWSFLSDIHFVENFCRRKVFTPKK